MNPTTEAAADPLPLPTDADPFFYGWRMRPRWNERGIHEWEKVPLTAEDVLHPEEDDFIVQTEAHDFDCHYLKDALEEVLRGREGVDVFTDLRIDWQVPGLGAHGPDIIAFEGMSEPWDRDRGTFPVRDMGARPLLIVEVTSPNTRDADLHDKVREYYRAGVPVYILVHRTESQGRTFVSVFGYRHTPIGYVRLPDDAGGVWAETVPLRIAPLGDRVACFTRNGQRILDRPELLQQREEFERLAIAAQVERDAERNRAESEKARAESEKARADLLARKYAELEAELQRLRGQ